jgi:hypothetical protein
LKGHSATAAFILWSVVVVTICGMRLFRGKAQRGTKT